MAGWSGEAGISLGEVDASLDARLASSSGEVGIVDRAFDPSASELELLEIWFEV